MDDLERRLKTLPLRKPSEGLGNRIFERRPSARERRGAVRGAGHGLHRRIPLAWAALLCLTTGVGGFATARMLNGGGDDGGGGIAPPPVTSSVRVRIIDAPIERNVFDFTGSSEDFLPGKYKVRVETGNEV